MPELVFSELCRNRRLQPGSKKNAIEDAIRPSVTSRGYAQGGEPAFGTRFQSSSNPAPKPVL